MMKCTHCDATVLSTSQPERLDDPFNRKQVEAVCRAVCGVEGVDPDSDVYGDGCDPQWSRYADAVATALAATPAVGGEPNGVLVDACMRLQAFLDTFGDVGGCETQADLNDWLAVPPASPLRALKHIEPPFGVYHNLTEIGDKNGHVCTAENPDIANDIVAALNIAAPPASPLRDALVAARPHVQEMSMRLPKDAAEDCAKTLNKIDAALLVSPLRGREWMAEIVYEGAHKGLRNCWKWSDPELDHEHPTSRGYYYKIADAVLAALSASPPEQQAAQDDTAKMHTSGRTKAGNDISGI